MHVEEYKAHNARVITVLYCTVYKMLNILSLCSVSKETGGSRERIISSVL